MEAKFKVGDLVRLKRYYTFDGLSNSKMVSNTGRLDFCENYRIIKSEISRTTGNRVLTFAECPSHPWTESRFEPAKNYIVTQILNDL